MRLLTTGKPIPLSVCLLLLAGAFQRVGAQEIPRAEYLSYMPLEVPRIIRQTPASERLQLYGDRDSPGYRDVDPVDGIDDRRHDVLQALATRFAPFLVQNTEAVPMDLKLFGEGRPFPLYIDTWNTATGVELVGEESIDWLNVASDPCTPFNPTADDCRLLELLEEYHPDRPASAFDRAEAIEPANEPFKVLWVDFPGESPKSWKEEFENQYSERLRREYRNFLKTYVHPFLEEVGPAGSGRYRLVLQYWFFYPYNDGGNNHEGDWEHIHVIVSPLDQVTEPGLSAAEMRDLLDGEWLDGTGGRQLVIKQVQYYFHSKVAILDFGDPNAYVPRADWERDIELRGQEVSGVELYWKYVRGMAFRDVEETQINTHPVGYIGADNKGLDQLLAAPGGTNRDSHGTYPAPGLFKDVGPAGAAENITNFFDHKKFYAASPDEQQRTLTKFSRGGVIFLGEPEEIEIVPDYERVIDLIMTDVEVRQEWAWLVLPMRFGYPASVSPFAGVVSHAETGNLAVVGPAFNSGWNRSGPSGQYKLYEPHVLSRLFPVDLQDAFINDWGFLNATLPVLSFLPPFDLLWRLVAAPFRALLGDLDPTLYPQESIPFRFVGLNGGVTVQDIPDDYFQLLLNPEQLDGILIRLVEYLIENGADSTTAVLSSTGFADDAVTPLFQVQLFIGDRFSTTNTIRRSRSKLGSTIEFSGIDDPFVLDSELNLWEYYGSLRYSVLTGGIQPYFKGGYGLSWYRMENTTTNGVLLEQPNSPWVRKPSLVPLENLLPNTWHVGFGLELIAIKSYARPPRGIDASLTAEWLYFTNKLGLDISGVGIEELIGLGVPAEDLPRERWVGRNTFNFVLTFGL